MRMRKYWAPGSLRYQLLSRMLLILAGLLIVIGLFQYVFMERFVFQNRALGIQKQIQAAPGDFWERFSPPPRRSPADAFMFFPAASVAFINAEGQTSILSNANPDSNVVPKLDDTRYAEARQQSRNNAPLFYVVKHSELGEQLVVLQAVRKFNHLIGVVQVSMSTKPLKMELYRQSMLFLGLSVAALAGGMLIFLPVIRRTLIPLSRIVSTVEQIDSGKLNERLPENQRQAEIDTLSHSFNRMLERLESSFLAEKDAKEQMRRFVADASHELRTPLTSIHGFLEVLLRGAASDPAQLNKALGSMYGESKRINKLVQDLLLLAKLDRKPEISLVPHSLSVIVKEMEPQLHMLAEGRRVGLELRGERLVPLDADKMKQVVLNLFHNAVQHTDPAEGAILVAVANVKDGVELTVADNGSGIPEAHLARLFDRFYRVDASRTRKHGGAGLGLSITRSIAELHGGVLSVQSLHGEGSAFRVFIPGGRRADNDERG